MYRAEREIASPPVCSLKPDSETEDAESEGEDVSLDKYRRQIYTSTDNPELPISLVPGQNQLRQRALRKGPALGKQAATSLCCLIVSNQTTCQCCGADPDQTASHRGLGLPF